MHIVQINFSGASEWSLNELISQFWQIDGWVKRSLSG